MTDLVKGAAVRTAAGVQNVIAEDVFAEALECALGESALFVHLLLGLLGDSFDDFFLEGIHEVVALFLGMLFSIESIVELGAVLFVEVLVDGFVKGKRFNNHLYRLDSRVQLLDGADNSLDLNVAEFESVDHGFFRDFESAGLDHDNGFFRAGDDDVQQTLLLFGDRRVGHQLAIEQADANASNGLLKREIGTIGGRGGGGNSDDVRIIVAVRGKHHRDDLCFVAPRLREERAHGPVNQTRGENLFFRRTTFALEEAAGDFSSRIGVFAIVDGQWKKIAVVGDRRHTGGGQHDRVAVTSGNGAVGLLGNLASFENERASPDFNRYLVWCWCVRIFRHR